MSSDRAGRRRRLSSSGKPPPTPSSSSTSKKGYSNMRSMSQQERLNAVLDFLPALRDSVDYIRDHSATISLKVGEKKKSTSRAADEYTQSMLGNKPSASSSGGRRSRMNKEHSFRTITTDHSSSSVNSKKMSSSSVTSPPTTRSMMHEKFERDKARSMEMVRANQHSKKSKGFLSKLRRKSPRIYD